MSAEANKSQMRRWFDALNDGTVLDVIGDIYATDCVIYDPGLPEPLRGQEALRGFLTGVLAAFPDAHYTLDDLLAEGDRVAVRSTGRATHRGDFAAVPATGKEVTFSLMSILRFEDGKVAEEWEMVDMLGLLQQVGAIPSPEAAGA